MRMGMGHTAVSTTQIYLLFYDILGILIMSNIRPPMCCSA